jgi:hypothetical protein
MFAKTRFPPPMASREYVYARRVWHKPDDGGCYCLTRVCDHEAPPALGGRVVRCGRTDGHNQRHCVAEGRPVAWLSCADGVGG